MNKYYKVGVKCGHVGRHKYITKIFAIMAESGKEAAYIARWMPRVKHNDKYAILFCKEIEEKEFNNLQEVNRNDPYLNCKSHQEQMNNRSDIGEVINEPKVVKQYKKKSVNLLFANKKYKAYEAVNRYETWQQ